MKRPIPIILLVALFGCVGCKTTEAVEESAIKAYSLPAIHKEAHEKLLSEQKRFHKVNLNTQDNGE